jgi:tRNA(fMet)-specific endonuclease VapC
LILDSSVLIDGERGRLDLRQRLAGAEHEAVVISSITASELLHGVHRARTSAQREKRRAFVDGVLDEVPVVDFGLAEARLPARLWADMARAGIAIGAHDLHIAATALSLRFRVVTGDRRDFDRVPGLEVESWIA